MSIRTAVIAPFAVLAMSLTPAQAADMTADQRKAIEAVIEDYLVKNPEVLERAFQALEAKRKLAQERSVSLALKTHAKDIYETPASPVAGNVNGDVTLVEFFDYRCGVCRRVHPIVEKLMESDANIRRVYVEWPILGPDSVFAARAALAARAQGDEKYWAFHDALMESRTAINKSTVAKIAEQVGLDTAKLLRDSESTEISEILAKNYAIAESLGLDGTPSFIIGDRVLRGGRDLATMKQLVAQVREAASRGTKTR